jgi:predicted TIM-barrel fold metal-dependent hydrolase
VAAKSQGAYLRGLNYRRVEPEVAEPFFDRMLDGEALAAEERKQVEDHLFWVCVDQATRHHLPVKIHTGYLAGERLTQFRRVPDHTRDIIELCRKGPETAFVFLHIGYPFWQELISVAKRFANAHVEMSWAWALDPVGTQEFLKRYLVTAPSNKVFTFGGDYSVVECVVGHAAMARQGLAQALTELVDEGWLGQHEALALVEPLMRSNAHELFRVEEKRQALSLAPWL